MKRFTSIILLLAMLLTSMPFITANAASADYLIIKQIYGGGGKGETPISNSFIELYNPTEGEVELSGYSVKDGTKTLDLDGKIPAKGSYLIIGAAESTTGDYLSYTLPEADKTCDWTINNKSYTIKLMNSDIEVDSVTAGGDNGLEISKQKSLRRADDGNLVAIVWKKTDVTVDEDYVTSYAPRNSKGDCGSVYKAGQEIQEPIYTPVQTSNVRVKGYFDADDTVKLELSARYNSGAMNPDGGSLEIVAYNPQNGYAYAVSGVKGKLIAVDLNSNTDGNTVCELNGTEYDLKALLEGFSYGDMTSVSVSPDGKKIAVAIQAENYADKGAVELFSCADNGTLALLSTVEVGVQPDMITFADNETVLTADEGEPREGTNGTDPKGSVTIVKIGNDNTLNANTVYFDDFDAKREELTSKGVLIQKDIQPSTDFEPEYIAVSGNTAYISLQEANAIAVFDITSKSFKDICPLGFQDYGATKVDLQKNDSIELKNYPNVYGIKMPDGISVTEIGGKTYLLTANEGDSRSDWANLDNQYEGKASPTGNVTLDEKVVWFNTAMWDGLDDDKDYVFGGRSFSIYEATDNGLTLVFDSGSEFEEITADKLADYFNTSNDKISLDNRSGKKGTEPESVTTGVIDNKIFAFVALERIGGIMVYDITDPANAKFANYINSREFEEEIKGDVSPEGICFIPAENSKTGKATLLAACEVSGTLAVYECDYKTQHTHNYGSEWKYDAKGHWHVCIECGEHDTVHAHEGGAPATATTPKKCDVCGYVMEPALGNSTSDEVKEPVPGNSTSDKVTVGTKLNDKKSKAIYKVTSVSAGKNTVQFVKPVSKTVKLFVIPDTIKIDDVTYKVTSVAKNAFAGCKKLAKVTIGKNVTSVGTMAFSGCSRLKTLSIGSNVTTIGDKAFYKCTALANVIIPSKVKRIGKQAFYGCKKLKTITIKTTKLKSSTVGSKAFKGIYSKATVKVPRSKLKSYKKILKAKGVSSKANIKK